MALNGWLQAIVLIILARFVCMAAWPKLLKPDASSYLDCIHEIRWIGRFMMYRIFNTFFLFVLFYFILLFFKKKETQNI